MTDLCAWAASHRDRAADRPVEATARIPAPQPRVCRWRGSDAWVSPSTRRAASRPSGRWTCAACRRRSRRPGGPAPPRPAAPSGKPGCAAPCWSRRPESRDPRMSAVRSTGKLYVRAVKQWETDIVKRFFGFFKRDKRSFSLSSFFL